MFDKKIKFYCSLPEVLEKYPIIKSKDFNYAWLKKSAIEYKKDLQTNSKYQHVNGTIKCTGIHSILNKGYILRSWFDLTIKTTNDPYKFEYIIPQEIAAYLEEKKYNKQLITWFSGDDSRLSVPLSENSLQTLIKIITPWAVSIPKGWNLLIQPIPYPDETAFTATHGILESGDFYEINPILAWHKKNEDVLIKAGTPLCQLIPIKETEIKVENLPYDDNIKKQEAQWRYNISHKFTRDYT
jgi:hypothetical protein